jgi:hypothetical protein
MAAISRHAMPAHHPSCWNWHAREHGLLTKISLTPCISSNAEINGFGEKSLQTFTTDAIFTKC